MKHKLLSILLCLAMALSLLPTTALAAEPVLQGYCGADTSYESQTYNYSTEWNHTTQTFTGTYYSNAVWTITENGTMPSDSTKPAYKLTISGTGAVGDFGTSWSFGRPWHFELIKNNIAVPDIRPSITAIEIGDGITEIGAHTFEAYQNVTSIVIPDSVTKIGEKAFNYCTGATSITLGSGLKEIGKTAFSDCDALTTISFPDKLETIGESAFSGCDKLSGDLVIPDSVKTIGGSAFANDTKLTGTLTIGNSVVSIGNSAFSGCKFTGTLSIPDSVTSIGNSAFTNCKFAELSLGNGLTEIGESALNTSGTYSGHLSIPDSVTTIGKTAFNGLQFSSISLGKAVSKIGQSAFENCTSIHSLDITAVSSSVTYGDSAFHSLRNPNTIYVNSDSQKSAIAAAITDGRTAFAITNGGTFQVTTQFIEGQLATPVKDGCIFDGWYTDEACTQNFTDTPTANSTYYAKWEEAAASVNGVGYTTLGAAITAAQDGNTIMLLKDVTENVTIPEGKERTLDLNGKNITVNSGCAIMNKGNLTVTGNGKVTAEKAAVANFPGAVANLNGGTYSSSNWYVIKNLGTMTIDGPVTVKKPDGSTDTSSLIDNGWYNNSVNDMNQDYPTSAVEVKLTIKSGDFSGKAGSDSCSVVKNDDYGVLEITGGTFDSSSNTGTSDATTILNWNVATISGGTFIGSYPISNGSYNNDADQGKLTISGGDFTGTSFLLGQATGGTPAAAKLSITGGIFNAPSFGEVDYKIEISGGSFTMDPTKYVVDGYVVNQSGSMYTVNSFTPEPPAPPVPPYSVIIPAITKKAPELNTTSHTAYVNGYPDGTVKPNGRITRAEVAAIFYRLLTEDSRKTYVTTKSGFYDVDSSKWYNTYVATLNNAGVITDSSNGYFRPDDAITRAELAAMLAQFAKTKGGAYSFTDVTVEHWAAYAITVCANLGWINGYPDGTFRPDATITRAEMMAMVNRATSRTPRDGARTWSDNADKAAWYYLDVQEATNNH